MVLEELWQQAAPNEDSEEAQAGNTELIKKKRFAGPHSQRHVFNKYKMHRANKLKY